MKTTFGERLCLARQALGYSQKNLAEMLYISQQAVAKWEADQTSPPPETLADLAEKLYTTIDFLIGNTPIPEPLLTARKRVQELIAEREFSDKAIGEFLDVDTRVLYAWLNERNDYFDRVCHLENLATMLRTNTDYLLGKSRDKQLRQPSSKIEKLTAEEEQLVLAYRENKSMQLPVKKLLDIGNRPKDTGSIKFSLRSDPVKKPTENELITIEQAIWEAEHYYNGEKNDEN